MKKILAHLFLGMTVGLLWGRPLLSCEECESTLTLQETIAQADFIFIGQKIQEITAPGIPPEIPPEILVRVDQLLKGFVKEKELKVHSFSGECPYGIVVDDKPYLMFIKGPPYTSVNLGCAVKTLPVHDGLIEAEGNDLTVSEFVAKYGLPVKETPKPDILFLIDFSREWFQEKEGKRIDCVQEALQNAISKLPPEQEIGVRLFGHRPPDIFGGGCKDTDLLVPLGQLKKEGVIEAVKKLELGERGYALLAYSLLKTGSDFGPRKDRLHKLVIISHGGDTCGDDTLLAARDVANMGYALEVSVIGLRAEGDAREELEGITKEFGGTFTNVTSCQEAEQIFLDMVLAGGEEQESPEGEEGGEEQEVAIGCGKGAIKWGQGKLGSMGMSARQKKGCGLGLWILLLLLLIWAIWRTIKKRKDRKKNPPSPRLR